MAVQASDFIYPTGYLRPVQLGFTTDADLETHIDNKWLDPLVAAIPTVTDEMKIAYVCWKSNEAISGAADKQSLGLTERKASHATEKYSDTANPFETFIGRAQECEDEYKKLLAVLDTTNNPYEQIIVW